MMQDYFTPKNEIKPINLKRLREVLHTLKVDLPTSQPFDPFVLINLNIRGQIL